MGGKLMLFLLLILCVVYLPFGVLKELIKDK